MPLKISAQHVPHYTVEKALRDAACIADVAIGRLANDRTRRSSNGSTRFEHLDHVLEQTWDPSTPHAKRLRGKLVRWLRCLSEMTSEQRAGARLTMVNGSKGMLWLSLDDPEKENEAGHLVHEIESMALAIRARMRTINAQGMEEGADPSDIEPTFDDLLEALQTFSREDLENLPPDLAEIKAEGHAG
ncbi:MAG: hypothetical protein PHI23_05280 [Candidatus Peribacteraceae bacterium]|nr:hypothetical protein [Candidatus Peribacteraceae bacterium]